MIDQLIDEVALGAWLEANVEGFSGPFTLMKFASGQSNPTYKISAASGEYVLRRKPFGQLLPSAHAVDREYRLLSALHPLEFPVPRPLALCDDPDVIGECARDLLDHLEAGSIDAVVIGAENAHPSKCLLF